jgi:hypothetical protein
MGGLCVVECRGVLVRTVATRWAERLCREMKLGTAIEIAEMAHGARLAHSLGGQWLQSACKGWFQDGAVP